MARHTRSKQQGKDLHPEVMTKRIVIISVVAVFGVVAIVAINNFL